VRGCLECWRRRGVGGLRGKGGKRGDDVRMSVGQTTGRARWTGEAGRDMITWLVFASFHRCPSSPISIPPSECPTSPLVPRWPSPTTLALLPLRPSTPLDLPPPKSHSSTSLTMTITSNKKTSHPLTRPPVFVPIYPHLTHT